MANVSLELIYKEIHDLKKDMEVIKHAILEEHELSDCAKKELIEARKTPESEYLSQKEMEKEFLQNDI